MKNLPETDINRFLEAQEIPYFCGYKQALEEVQNGKKTSTVVNSKSISKDGGICTFRSNVKVTPNATNSKLTISCESLMMDSKSRSDTIPVEEEEGPGY